MDTAKGLIAAAAVLVIGGGVAAYAVTPRYTLGNPGGGVSVRLDRRSGDMLGCQGMACRQMVKGETIAADPAALPPGFVLDPPTGNAS